MSLRFFILMVGLLRVLPAYAQQAPLDSLLRQEKTYLQEDTVRVKLLIDIARRYYTSDAVKGAAYAEKAVALAEKLPEKRFLASAHSVMGTNQYTLTDFTNALEHYLKALDINERLGNLQGTANNFNNIGLVYYSIFDYPKALEYYQKTLNINEKTGNKTGIANSLGNIGNIHNELRDYRKAIEYFQHALEISESIGYQPGITGNLVNLGNAYTQLKDFSKALEYKQRALKINEQLGNQSRIANNLGNIGNVYLELQDYDQAFDYHQRALAIFEKINDKKNIIASYASLGDVLRLQKKYDEALHFESKAYDQAAALGLVNTQSDALFNLSKIYVATEKFDSAYHAYFGYVLLRDSITNVEKQKEVTRQSLQFEFGKKEEALRQQQALTDAKLEQQILIAAKRQQELELKQKAVDLATKEKELQHLAYLKSQADLQFEQSLSRQKEEQLVLAENEKKLQATQVNLQQTQLQLKDRELQTQKTQGLFYIAGLVLLSLLSFFIFRNFRNQKKSNRIIEGEKQKSDNLLLNILPAEVASELKDSGQAAARQFDQVTVLFTDFVDFTLISEKLSAQDLVSELHRHFKAFDEIIERYGLEKIKTIGDSYMAVSGLPVPNADHARRAALAAQDILRYMRAHGRDGAGQFEIRIGLHSGPVVAGIVGVKKFAYDIWGDTVNTASRMESSSEPGKINISGATHALIRDEFSCQYRGKLAAKNKGEIDMYFLTVGF